MLPTCQCRWCRRRKRSVGVKRWLSRDCVADEIGMALPWPPAVGDVIDDRWEVRILCPNTDFYRRYDVWDRKDLSWATCWIEHFAGPVLTLRYDVLIFKELTMMGLSSIPEFVSYGETDSVHYLCTKRVGPTLEEIRAGLPPIAEGRFSLCTCLHIGMETLFSLKEYHDAGYMHRNLKPSMFALTCSPSSQILMLPDGLSKRWLNFAGDGPLPVPQGQALLRSNLKYGSINALRLNHQSRFDDLWSWFYMLYDLTFGSLPWPPLEGDTIIEQLANFAVAKETVHSTGWLDNAPPEYKEIFKYLTAAPPESDPDYDRLTSLLSAALARAAPANGDEYTLDWEPGGQYHDPLQQVLAIYSNE